MAKQIKATIIGIQNEYPLCFGTESFFAKDGEGVAGASSVIYSYNESPNGQPAKYNAKETVSQLLAIANENDVSMVVVNVLNVDGVPNKFSGIFPANSMLMGKSPDSKKGKAYIQFKGITYYTAENYYDLLNMANQQVIKPVSYKSFIGLISQTGTLAPVATTFENTIGTIVWSYVSPGFYKGVLANAFPAGKTIILTQGGIWSGPTDNVITVRRIDNNSIELLTGGVIDEQPRDGVLNQYSVQIMVYP